MRRFDTVTQANWDWRAAFNFMFGGTGGALLFVAAMDAYPATPPLLLMVIALALVGAGLFCVWLEIGRPLRFLHVFFHPHTSWMTREAVVAAALFIAAISAMVSGSSNLMLGAGLLGLGFMFFQGRILRASKGIPAWREPSASYLVIVTGLCEGTGILLLSMTATNRLTFPWISLYVLLLAARILVWRRYRKRLLAGGAPRRTETVLASMNGVVCHLGTLVPVVLVVVLLALPWVFKSMPAIGDESALIENTLLIGIFLLAIFSGWYLKFNLITNASQVQGYALGRLNKGRPAIRPPIARKADRL